MSGIVLTLPILPGKEEAWRRFCQELHRIGLAAVEHAAVELPRFSQPQLIIEWELSAEPESRKQRGQ
jgi:hypothetical protein